MDSGLHRNDGNWIDAGSSRLWLEYTQTAQWLQGAGKGKRVIVRRNRASSPIPTEDEGQLACRARCSWMIFLLATVCRLETFGLSPPRYCSRVTVGTLRPSTSGYMVQRSQARSLGWAPAGALPTGRLRRFSQLVVRIYA